MTKNLRSELAEVIHKIGGRQTKADGTLLSNDELFDTPVEQLDLSSLSFLEIIMEIELRFGIELPEVDPDNYQKISDLEADLLKATKGNQVAE